MKKTYWLLALFLLPLTPGVSAQEFFENENEPVHAFRAPLIINSQTTEMPPEGGFEFYIRHRFGFVRMNKTLISEFLGMDGIANIRFSFVFLLNKTLAGGIGRSKSGKTYDVEFKQIILRQKTNHSIPVSVAAYCDLALNTDAFQEVSKYAYFEDRRTRFINKFSHRLSYNSQLIISRKFGDILSVQAAPAYLYRNLVPAGSENYTLALPAGGALKLGLNSSFIFEYCYRFNNKPANGLYPASIGIEFGTVSHVFQIVISSNKELTEQLAYSTESTQYDQGEVSIGFNMKRTFWNKKKKKTI